MLEGNRYGISEDEKGLTAYSLADVMTHYKCSYRPCKKGGAVTS